MAKEKYFRSLPDQLYLYKRFDSVGKKEGCECDECGAWLQNIVTVVGSVDHLEYHLGLTCCEKSSKGMKNINLDDKTTQYVKYWKKRLNQLKNFRKDFDKKMAYGKVIAILGSFYYNVQKKTTSIDFTFLYEGGDWWRMNSDVSITGYYNKVKETFADVWDIVDWKGYEDCAAATTSKEVWDILHDNSRNVRLRDFNKRTEEDYPEWNRCCTVRAAIRQSFDYNTGWGEGKTIKLPVWFNKDEYDDIFDKVLANYNGYQNLDKTTFINGYDAEKMSRYK